MLILASEPGTVETGMVFGNLDGGCRNECVVDNSAGMAVLAKKQKEFEM